MKNRTAVVTGADRGLGLALAAGLLEKKWRVFAGQFLPDWPELSELESRYPDHLTVVPLDVASQSSVRDAARAAAAASKGQQLVWSLRKRPYRRWPIFLGTRQMKIAC